MALYLGSKKIASGAILNDGSGSGGDGIPIGVILEYPADTPPNGWLICDGSAVSRTEYNDLFTTIGTTYGNGDGSTTFNLPNLKGKVPVGKDSSQSEFNILNKIGGEKTHKLTINEIPSHNHVMSAVRQWNSSGGYPWVANGEVYKAIENGVTTSVGGSQSHNNLQPYIVVNYIIKVTKEVSSSSVNEIYNVIYPIGRGFIDFTNTDYSNWLGFTWERELVGLTPIGYKSGDSDFGTIGKTLGSKTSTIKTENLPGTVTIRANRVNAYGNQNWSGPLNGWGNYQNDRGDNVKTDEPINIVQPSKVVAYWKRVA